MQKELLFDIETSPNLAYVWEKYEQDVISFEKERELLSFAYKWSGKKNVKSYCLGDLSPLKLTAKLHKLFDEADIIVAHNGDNFDIKMANAFFAYFNFKPPSPYKTIDTLKIAKSRFRFNSNKLNDLGMYLGLGEKVDTGGFKLWLKCIKGDKKSWKKMKKYNRRDVVLLERVYLRLRPWAKNLTSKEYGLKCPVCGSEKIQLRGWNINKVFKSRRFQCQSCGHWSSSNQRIKYRDGEYLK